MTVFLNGWTYLILSLPKNLNVTATVDVGAINAGEYENINVTVSDIESDNCYAVLISPQVAMPDDVSIDYAYVSSDNTITVKFINRVASVVDGGGGSASTPITDLKLNIMICMTERAATVTTTTTTLPPVADDVYSWGGNEFGQLGINNDKSKSSSIYCRFRIMETFALGHYPHWVLTVMVNYFLLVLIIMVN